MKTDAACQNEDQASLLGGPTLETGVTVAAAAAGADLSSQFQNGQFGEEAVHPSNRAEVLAPEALFKQQCADHSTTGDSPVAGSEGSKATTRPRTA